MTTETDVDGIDARARRCEGVARQAALVVTRLPGMKSHEVLKETVDTLGAKKVAADLGISLSLLYKWSEPTDESGAQNPLDRVAQLSKITNDPRCVMWLCQQMNGVYVKNPASLGGKSDVLRATQRLLKEFSDVLMAVSLAWEDSRVTTAEAEKIRAEWDELKSIAETFVLSCEDHARGKR